MLRLNRQAPAIVLVLLCSIVHSEQQSAPRGFTVISSQTDDPKPFLQQPKLALVVGIDNYPDDSGFGPLRFAANDARDLSARLTAEGYQTVTLINEKAAGREIIKKLDDLLRSLNGAEGTIIFTFSGHGGQVKDSQYLALPDTRLSLLEETGLPLADVRRLLERSSAPRKVMFIDACRSDTAARGSEVAAAEVFGELGRARGIAILNAAEPKRVSFEDPITRHGVFTNFLLGGLEGKAAGPNGLITFNSLLSYVAREMEVYGRRTGRQQRPYQTVDGIGDFYLAGTLKTTRGGIIRTIAGRPWRFAAEGARALDVDLGQPWGVASDAGGNLYVTDMAANAVVRVDPMGIVHILAGPDSAPVNRPDAPDPIAVDKAGIVYYGENGNKVKKLMPDGRTTVLAGINRRGFSPDGAIAAGSAIGRVHGLALASDGSVYFSEWDNARVRRIDDHGRLRTVAGNSVAAFSGDGGPADRASLSHPSGLQFDAQGNLYIADQGNGRVRRVDPAGMISTVARSDAGGCPTSIAFSPKGEMLFSDTCRWRIYAVRDGRRYLVANNGYALRRLAGIGGPAIEASFDGFGLAFDREGTMIVSGRDFGNLFRIGQDGKLAIIAGGGLFMATRDGTPAADAVFHPNRIYVAESGEILVSDFSRHRIYRIDQQRRVTLMAGLGVPGSENDGAIAREARINGPMGITIGPNGTLVFVESGANCIREITKEGRLRTLAGNGRGEFAGDGGPAADASLKLPRSLCYDSAGNLFIADTGNQRIRKVGTDGKIETIAGGLMTGFSGDGGPAARALLNNPRGVAIGPDGALYIADTFNRRVRRVSPDGVITTFAGDGSTGSGGDGGPARQASFISLDEVAFGPSGSLYIRDSTAGRIRKVDLRRGIISTVAGNGQSIVSGEGGPATAAGLGSLVHGISIDKAGNLYIADEVSGLIRVVRPD